MKRLALFSFVSLLLCLVPALSGFAQSPAQSAIPARDLQAVAVVQNALAVLGGPALGLIQSCVAQGTQDPGNGGWMTPGDFTWEHSGSEFRYVSPAPSGRSVLVSNGGKPLVSEAGKTSKVRLHVAAALFPAHLPGWVLLQEFRNQAYSFSFVGNETLDGRPVAHIRTTLVQDQVTASITPQDWFVDLASWLPVRIVRRSPAASNALLTILEISDLSDYRTVSGVQVPFQITIYEDGQLSGVAKLSSVQINASVSPTDFEAPGGGL